MNWDAPHADYIIASYLLALIVVMWCIASTWQASRRYKVKEKR